MVKLFFDMDIFVISDWFIRILYEFNAFLLILQLIIINFNIFDKVKI